jgi:uncharacterized protein (DUF427 family)
VTDRPILEPTPEHPINIKPTGGRVTVHVDGHQVATTRNALTLIESTFPAVQYILMRDVESTLLKDSATTTYCPYKGDAEYLSVATDKGTVKDVVWTYNAPFPAVAVIGQHVAFSTDRAVVTVSAW